MILRASSRLSRAPSSLALPLPLALLLPAVLCVAPAASAQFGPRLPATAPTDAAVASPINATAPVIAATHAQRATVQYSGGLLTVVANDSSLTQILHSISRATGMTISGGIPEQRVFGSYGPADPTSLVTTLLDGTGTNVLLLAATDEKALQLILTPRSGVVTPPSATVSDASEDDDAPTPQAAPQAPPARAAQGSGPRPPYRPFGDQLPVAGGDRSALVPANSPSNANSPSTAPSIAQPVNNVLGNPANQTPTASQIPTTNSVPLNTLPTPSTTVSNTQGIVDTPNPPQPGGLNPLAPAAVDSNVNSQTDTPPATTSADTSTSGAAATTSGDASSADSSNKAKTPEQILKELQQLLQKKPQP